GPGGALGARGRRRRLVRLQLALAPRPVELAADSGQARLHEIRVHVQQHHREAALRGHLRDARAHLSCAHHRQRLHVHGKSLRGKGPGSVDPGRRESIARSGVFRARRPLLYARFVEARVFQGIVDDAAAICGALLAELRVRRDLLGEEGVELGLAALGGTLATGKARREQTAKRLRELADRAPIPEGAEEKSLRLSRVAAEVSETLEGGAEVAPVALWGAVRPRGLG